MGSRCTKVISLLSVAIALAAAFLFLVRASQASATTRNGKIAFGDFVESTSSFEGFTINPDGTGLVQVTHFGPNVSSANSPTWSRDGRQLTVATFNQDGVPQIWVMNADGGNAHIVFTDTLPAIDFNATFSPDASHIAFTRCQNQGPPCGIFQIRADGSDLTPITDFDFNPDIIDAFPRYSPDGDEVIFTNLNRDGVLEALYSVHINGTHVRRLTAPAVGGANPAFSRNGDFIAFDDNDPFCDGGACFFPNSQISIIDSDGDHFREITHFSDSFNLHPSWAPEGNAIVFEQDSPDFSTSDLQIIDVNQDAPRCLPIHHRDARRIRQSAPMNRLKMADRTGHIRMLTSSGFGPEWGVLPRF